MKYYKNKSDTFTVSIFLIFLPRVSFTAYLKVNKHFTPMPNFLLKSTSLAIEGNLAFTKA